MVLSCCPIGLLLSCWLVVYVAVRHNSDGENVIASNEDNKLRAQFRSKSHLLKLLLKHF